MDRRGGSDGQWLCHVLLTSSGGLLGCKPDPSEGILGLDHAVLAVGFGKDANIENL